VNFADVPRPAFGRSAQHLPGQPRPHRSRPKNRRMYQARLAAELLPRLPPPGETIHCLMTGRYDLTQVVAAAAALKPVRHLRVASLCYSRNNAAELTALVRSGCVGRLTLLVSEFFRSHNKDLHESFAADLTAFPGCRLAAARSHCKVVCFDYDDADGMVFEGSANLRTNRNREQLAVTRDRPLHDWHAAWIDDMVGSDGGRG
jgi:hypothetical protein